MPHLVPPPEPPAIVCIIPPQTEPTRPFQLKCPKSVAKPTRPETITLSSKATPEDAPSKNAAALSGPESISTSGLLAQTPPPPATSPGTNTPGINNPDTNTPAPPPAPAPATPSAPPSNIPTQQLTNQGFLELRADRQVYDERRQVFTAEGNVSLRFRGALLTSDRLQVNLGNRLAVADGNVILTRGEQVLRGRRFRYNLVQEEGTIEQGSGEIFLPSTATDFNPNLPTNITAGTVPGGSVGDITQQNVTSAGGIRLTLGSRRNPSGAPVVPDKNGGQVRRLRFQAAQIAFYPEGWQARDVRITNDPFSPPELELRTERAELRRISPQRDEVRTVRPRLVFDQGFSLPLFRDRVTLDRTQRAPALVNFGFDADDRGGVFIERNINVFPQGPVQFSVTPQFYVQRAVQRNDSLSDLFGLRTELSAPLGPRTQIRGEGVLTSFDFNRVEETLRGSLRAQQFIGTHTLSLEASYRDRLFNNSLGFQDVQSSIGALFFSPVIPIGQTGINLSYQVGYQRINARTDRAELLLPNRSNDRVDLGRFQASAALNYGFLLWQGRALPATPDKGLRYTPTPVRPYVGMAFGLTGVGTAYSNGDNQNNLNASVGIFGQFGNFSRNFLDYTAFNITYTQVFRDGSSPFLFDRVVDDRILFAGITQQLYGPIRIGFQTAYNIQTGREISTDYILEYNRRTYSVALRYNPVLGLGSVSFQIGDFNWNRGSTEPFDGSGVIPVEGGVRRLPQ